MPWDALQWTVRLLLALLCASACFGVSERSCSSLAPFHHRSLLMCRCCPLLPCRAFRPVLRCSPDQDCAHLRPLLCQLGQITNCFDTHRGKGLRFRAANLDQGGNRPANSFSSSPVSEFFLYYASEVWFRNRAPGNNSKHSSRPYWLVVKHIMQSSQADAG